MTLRRILGLLIILASFALWLPASDVLAMVLNSEPVLLGRYSVNRLASLLAATPLLWLLAWLLLSGRRFDRQLALQALAVAGSCVLGLAAVSVVSYAITPARYVIEPVAEALSRQSMATPSADKKHFALPPNLQGSAVHRVPGMRLSFTYDDVPPVGRSYPQPPPGHPRVAGTLTTDSRGFRNRRALDRADVVVVGDSFAEGNRVSDEDAWPEVLARSSRLSVYNLGISFLAPQEYLNNFVVYGLGLEPGTVILMFYEGNDFVVAEHEFPLSSHGLLRDSPLGSALNGFLLRTFGPLNANAPLPPSPALSWMPVTLRSSGKVRYYSLGPGRLNRLMLTRQELIRSPKWTGTARILKQFQQAARDNGIRLILAYAPTSDHVVLPLIRDQLSDEGLYAFAAVREKSAALPVADFKSHVFARLDTKEDTLREFCQAEGIEFVSLTPVLQALAAAGEQAYYTYDTHWSPAGQRAVGEALAQYLQLHPTPSRQQPANRPLGP